MAFQTWPSRPERGLPPVLSYNDVGSPISRRTRTAASTAAPATTPARPPPAGADMAAVSPATPAQAAHARRTAPETMADILKEKWREHEQHAQQEARRRRQAQQAEDGAAADAAAAAAYHHHPAAEHLFASLTLADAAEARRAIDAYLAGGTHRDLNTARAAGGATPLLHVAQVCPRARGGAAADMVSALLARGADAGATNETGQTALHYAVSRFDDADATRLAALLCDAGAPPNAQDAAGTTALLWASEAGNGATARHVAPFHERIL